MRRTALLFLAIILGLLLMAPALMAQPPAAPAPQWLPVPQVPGVQYAPELSGDFFRYGGQYYHSQGDRWYQGPGANGPWKSIKTPPAAFYNIGPTYFKNPPGWAKGKKTGWGGAPAQPGQMKKMERGGSLPPGQMKKLD